MKINAITAGNYSFKGNNTLRNTGFALAATTLLTGACDTKPQKDTNPINTELCDTTNNKINSDNIGSSKIYYYYPTENGRLDLNKYDWSETRYNDGRIIRDSAGYNILITPNDEKTITYSQEDEFGNKTTTIKYPNGKTFVRTDYKLKNPAEILYTEHTYNKDNVIVESKYYNKMPSDSIPGDFTIEQSNEIRNDEGILLRWESNVRDPERNKSYNKYDKLGRLIYDDEKDEHYVYKNSDQFPKYSYSIYDGCKRITEYDENAAIKKVYFKASDGTISE